MVRVGTGWINILVLGGSILLSFLLYFQVLNNTFLSDDYDSLYRIIIKKDILFKGFLRPLIDLSFYFNYAISGLNAVSYYVFNILVHAINAWLLYKVAMRFTVFGQHVQQLFAIMTALLFLIYPFHSESIVWLSGRLSSLACLCALIALHVMLGNWEPWKKKLLAIIVYFIGLHAYESILLLPLIIIAWQWKKGQSFKSILVEGILWGAVMLFYLLWRYLISGVIFNNYAEHIVDNRLLKYIGMGLKTLGRSVLPPQDNPQLMIVLFCCVSLIMLLLHYFFYRRIQKEKTFVYRYLQLTIAFFIAILIPILFGISTRTPEGDRLFYFPSCFLCMILSFLLLVLIQKNSYRWGIISFLAATGVYLTVTNNKQWIRASDLTKAVYQKVQQANGRQLVLINLPEELDGAFVFRNGFYNSLLVHGVDTSRIIVSHYLKRSEALATGDVITVNKESNRLFIYPATYLIDSQSNVIELQGDQNEYLATIIKNNSVIYYWNNRELVKLF